MGKNYKDISFIKKCQKYRFLAQDKSEIEYIKEVFKLSDGEAYFLTTCARGEGLLKVGEDTAIIAIKPTKKEFEFVETNLNKLRKEEE